MKYQPLVYNLILTEERKGLGYICKLTTRKMAFSDNFFNDNLLFGH